MDYDIMSRKGRPKNIKWINHMKILNYIKVNSNLKIENTMADGGQIMRFKLDSNEILLYNWPPCAHNWNLTKPTN